MALERPSTAELAWATEVRSPRADSHPVEPELARRCGVPDAGLSAAARELSAARRSGEPAPDTERVTFALRRAGSPYTWPRLWSLTGSALDASTVEPALQRWLASFSDDGERRCGLGLATGTDGVETLTAVVVDVQADLTALPVRTRTGAWLRLEAQLLVPASDARVLLLGPRGRPRSLPTAFETSQVRASFALAEPGQWLVQVLAETTLGPRPVAEALLHADVAPPPTPVALPVPGELAGSNERDPTRALLAMLTAARDSEALPRLDVDPTLVAVATAHAEAMRAAQRLGHDVGAGALPARLAAADLVARIGGENVARAATPGRAHRVLWQSPSHRETLLGPAYDAVGIGVAEDDGGTYWVCQVFVGR